MHHLVFSSDHPGKALFEITPMVTYKQSIYFKILSTGHLLPLLCLLDCQEKVRNTSMKKSQNTVLIIPRTWSVLILMSLVFHLLFMLRHLLLHLHHWHHPLNKITISLTISSFFFISHIHFHSVTVVSHAQQDYNLRN